MAEKPAAERTEAPTPERLRKAREEGQVPHSQEVGTALFVALLLVVSTLMAGPIYRWLVESVRTGLSCGTKGSMDIPAFQAVFQDAFFAAGTVILPFLIAAAAMSIFSSVIVSGLSYSPKAMRFNWDRIHPAKGFANLVSLKSLMNMLASLAKLAVLYFIVRHFLAEKQGELASLHWSSPAAALAATMRLLGVLVMRILIGLFAVAGLDWLYQRWQHTRQLRMTRQEVKEERKQYEQSPQTRSRIRGIQITLARKRMLQKVATADVVVTNPTHVAVALRYDSPNMEAPEVVAKGADLLAEKIRELARKHNVPIVQKPALARAIYTTVDAGQPVPESLFFAVAEVLAMIYKLRAERRGETV